MIVNAASCAVTAVSPIVTTLDVPAQVDIAVFSTRLRPTSVCVVACALRPE